MNRIARRDFIKMSMAVLVSNTVASPINAVARAREVKGTTQWNKVVTEAVDGSGWVDYVKISGVLKREFNGF